MKVWAHMYNSCIYESADAVQSLHMTEAGAIGAMQDAKYEEFIRWQECQQYHSDPTNGMLDCVEDKYVPKNWQVHSIKEMEVLE